MGTRRDGVTYAVKERSQCKKINTDVTNDPLNRMLTAVVMVFSCLFVSFIYDVIFNVKMRCCVLMSGKDDVQENGLVTN